MIQLKCLGLHCPSFVEPIPNELVHLCFKILKIQKDFQILIKHHFRLTEFT